MSVGVRPDGTIEYLRLHGARNDVNGYRHSPLAPVCSEPLAEGDEPVTLVVDAREESLERSPEGRETRLHDLASREPLGQENLACRGKVRRVDAKEWHSLHGTKPDAEFQKQRGGLGEAEVEIPPARSKIQGARGIGRRTPGYAL